jgi:hypothetical protein
MNRIDQFKERERLRQELNNKSKPKESPVDKEIINLEKNVNKMMKKIKPQRYVPLFSLAGNDQPPTNESSWA